VAGTIRYVRRGRAEKREADKEFQIGIGVRLVLLPSGGYPARERHLPEDIRQTIFKRDDYLCRLCRKKPATQIDHINGSSNNPSNLQAVCADCNRKKMYANLRRATSKEEKLIIELYLSMAARIASPFPLLACDNQDAWKKMQPKITAARKRAFKEIQDEIETADDESWENTDGYVAHVMAKDD
jgi:hypothetical protein